MVFVVVKIFLKAEKIFFVIEEIFYVVVTKVSATGNIFFETQTMLFASDNIFFTTKSIFCVAEKTVGEAPTDFWATATMNSKQRPTRRSTLLFTGLPGRMMRH